jgi:hypothetical protein
MEFEIDAQERELLVRLVEQALGDTRVEIRRTSTPEFRDRLQAEELILTSVLRRLGATRRSCGRLPSLPPQSSRSGAAP